MHESTHTTATRHAPRIAPMVALARGLGAACRISVARLRPAESDVRSMSSTRSKTVGAVRQVRENLKTCGDHTPTSGFVARVDSASQWSHAAGSSRHAAHNVTLLTGQPNQRGLGDLFWVNGVPSLSTLQILRAVGKQQCMVACPHCHHAVISGTALP